MKANKNYNPFNFDSLLNESFQDNFGLSMEGSSKPKPSNKQKTRKKLYYSARVKRIGESSHEGEYNDISNPYNNYFGF